MAYRNSYSRYFLLFLVLVFTCGNAIAQKDTLDLYHQGIQVLLADNNNVNITQWANGLNGKHTDVTIIGYYETSEFKKYIQKRIEELNLVVPRKARDFTTIKAV